MKNRRQKINLIEDRLIINILGEVCWGFVVEDFEKKIGAEKKIVEKLLNFLLENEKNNTEDIYLNEDDIKIIKNSFMIILHEMGDWEFPIRMGISIERAKEIINKLL